jgi:hypothetical protein
MSITVNILDMPPERRTSLTTWVDLDLAHLTGIGAHLFRQPMYGVGFGGRCPPGAQLWVVPMQCSGLLSNAVLSDGLGGIRDDGLPPEIAVLRPGDVLGFGQLLRDGIAALVRLPYGGWEQFTNITSNVTPRPIPTLRIFQTPTLPASVGYSPCPLTREIFSTNSDAPVTATVFPEGQDALAVAIAPSATHVTIHLLDNSAEPQQRIQGAESGTYEVWWLLASGLWCHNPADDFSAAERGVASASHDVEVYQVSGQVRAVYVRKTGGSDFFASVTLSEVPQ